MHHLRSIVMTGWLLCASGAPVVPTTALAQTSADPVALIIRTDDIGMSHSVNVAMQKLVSTGMPVSVSVMFACPWYQEAVEILKQHPNASVGIHLVLNSEWKNYRWGPVSGGAAVPSLVDENGYFFPAAEALRQHNPNVTEVEKELRAQIERALRSGVKIDYVDYHMGTAVMWPDFQAVTERLAQEYGLGMSHYFGETEDSPQYAAAPARKMDSLSVMIDRMKPGLNLVITHVGIDDAELGALLDMNTSDPLPDMSKNRQGELTALMSARFSAALKARNVVLLTYRDVIAKEGLKSMRRPVE
jgi:chitin disaccharide deacetylase